MDDRPANTSAPGRRARRGGRGEEGCAAATDPSMAPNNVRSAVQNNEHPYTRILIVLYLRVKLFFDKRDFVCQFVLLGDPSTRSEPLSIRANRIFRLVALKWSVGWSENTTPANRPKFSIPAGQSRFLH